MTQTTLRNIHRPRILIKAAQIGALQYKRETNLRQILRCVTLPKHTTAVERLAAQENALEEARKTGEASYSITRHISILAALLAEIRFLPDHVR
ncbi:hypothetical protein GCM10007939_07470 [Amylibacter marinus]|uniref:FCD domain-containing protein n=1 Tax=Amylibacter marinus TaxID=1475483 RepID=A0ABQ5VT09_9RHOB|nr:DUF6477 family protein [Amylibacter marinus]GLQ34464.1 hypothetical protein GCM10007939_07470 [Amylibacter marinus]